GCAGRTARGRALRRPPAFRGWSSSPFLRPPAPAVASAALAAVFSSARKLSAPLVVPSGFLPLPVPAPVLVALAAVPGAVAVVVARPVTGQREVDLAAHDADRLDLDPDAVAERERAARPPPDQPRARFVVDIEVVRQSLDPDQSLDEWIVDDDE